MHGLRRGSKLLSRECFLTPNFRRKKRLLCQSLESGLERDVHVVGAPLPLPGPGLPARPLRVPPPAPPGPLLKEEENLAAGGCASIPSALWRENQVLWLHAQPDSSRAERASVTRLQYFSSPPHLAAARCTGWREVRRGRRTRVGRRRWHRGGLLWWRRPGSPEPWLAVSSFIHLDMPRNSLTGLPRDFTEPRPVWGSASM
ncbi:hypothetical protein HJG60_007775 [Phyllostomus discolor]|uniref:Uncharacterized protein n=1 Tax=Phyllostomus discolor TaxID=89673 RepID=A0A834BD13_9CHIR|nr:hypothetical protein HJG60_007775 [Phyllostomus discolor]